MYILNLPDTWEVPGVCGTMLTGKPASAGFVVLLGLPKTLSLTSTSSWQRTPTCSSNQVKTGPDTCVAMPEIDCMYMCRCD